MLLLYILYFMILRALLIGVICVVNGHVLIRGAPRSAVERLRSFEGSQPKGGIRLLNCTSFSVDILLVLCVWPLAFGLMANSHMHGVARAGFCQATSQCVATSSNLPLLVIRSFIILGAILLM